MCRAYIPNFFTLLSLAWIWESNCSNVIEYGAISFTPNCETVRMTAAHTHTQVLLKQLRQATAVKQAVVLTNRPCPSQTQVNLRAR